MASKIEINIYLDGDKADIYVVKTHKTDMFSINMKENNLKKYVKKLAKEINCPLSRAMVIKANGQDFNLFETVERKGF